MITAYSFILDIFNKKIGYSVQNFLYISQGIVHYMKHFGDDPGMPQIYKINPLIPNIKGLDEDCVSMQGNKNDLETHLHFYTLYLCVGPLELGSRAIKIIRAMCPLISLRR